MKRIFLTLLFIIFLGSSATLFVQPSYAGSGSVVPSNDPLGVDYGSESGLSSQDIRITIALTVNVILNFLGIIAVVIVLYAGFKWMMSGGEEEKVKSAQKMLAAAVIGLVIILTAYAISYFVLVHLYNASGGVYVT